MEFWQIALIVIGLGIAGLGALIGVCKLVLNYEAEAEQKR